MTIEARIAEVLADHQHGASVPASLRVECDDHLACTCGWVSERCKQMTAREEHRTHVAAVIAALPDIATPSISSAEYGRRDHASQRDGIAAFYPRSEYP